MTKQQLKKLDNLFGKIIRSRGKCQWCGSKLGQLQTAHIISRRFMNTRWDTDNALCLDARCHRKAHDNPLLFADFVFNLIGKEAYYKLLKKSQLKVKLFYEDILDKLSDRA